MAGFAISGFEPWGSAGLVNFITYINASLPHSVPRPLSDDALNDCVVMSVRFVVSILFSMCDFVVTFSLLSSDPHYHYPLNANHTTYACRNSCLYARGRLHRCGYSFNYEFLVQAVITSRSELLKAGFRFLYRHNLNGRAISTLVQNINNTERMEKTARRGASKLVRFTKYFRVIKSRRIIWARYVACMGKLKCI